MADYDFSAFDKAQEKALADESAKSPSSISPEEALARAGAKGLTMNFSDEIAGAAASPLGAAEAASRYLPVVGKKGPASPEEEAYKKAQQEYEARDIAAAAEYPRTSVGGELLGGGIGMLAGGAAAKAGAKGLPLLARLVKAYEGAGIGGQAALQGGLAGAGESHAEGDIGQLAKDTAVTAGLSAGIGGAASKLGAKMLPSNLKKEAAEEVLQMSGMSPSARAKLGKEAQEKIGTTLLENKVPTLGGTTESVLANANKLNEKSSKTIQDVIKASGNQGMVDPQVLKSQIAEKLGPELDTPLNADIKHFYENLNKAVDSLGNRPIPFDKAEEFKKLIAARGWTNGKPIETEIGAQARQAWKIVSDTNEASLDKYAQALDNPQLLKTFQDAKTQYFSTEKVLKPLEVKAEKEATSSLLSPSNLAAAGAGALAAPHIGMGKLLGGAAGYLAKKGIEKYAPAASPVLKYGAAKGMEKVSELPVVGKMLTKGIDLAKPVINPSNLGRVGANHITRALSGYSPEQLQNTANQLSSSDDTISKSYGNSLSKIAEEKDPQMKNAMLFTLEQQDNFRERMKDLMENEAGQPVDAEESSTAHDTGEQ